MYAVQAAVPAEVSVDFSHGSQRPLPHDPEVDSGHESRLVAAALRGDGRAYAQLVEPHLARAFRVAARQTRDRGMAEDVVQDALVVLHRELAKYRPGTSLKALIFAIVVRAALTQRRSSWRRSLRELVSDGPQAWQPPDRQVEDRELADRVDRALQTLPERRRQAILLRFDADLSHAEVAAALETSEAAARQLVYEATKALRAALVDLAPGGSHG